MPDALWRGVRPVQLMVPIHRREDAAMYVQTKGWVLSGTALLAGKQRHRSWT